MTLRCPFGWRLFGTPRVVTVAPYTPSLDFSLAGNSQFLVLLAGDF